MQALYVYVLVTATDLFMLTWNPPARRNRWLEPAVPNLYASRCSRKCSQRPASCSLSRPFSLATARCEARQPDSTYRGSRSTLLRFEDSLTKRWTTLLSFTPSIDRQTGSHRPLYEQVYAPPSCCDIHMSWCVSRTHACTATNAGHLYIGNFHLDLDSI